MLDQLVSSEPFRHGDLPALPAAQGVYLFSEGERHIYVGITRNIRYRYGQHQRPSSPENSAPFAFAIARSEPERDGFPLADRSRKNLNRDPQFDQRYFRPAKDRVRAMDFRYWLVPPDDSDADPKIAVFEVFVSMVLGTEGDFNLFRTH